MTETIPSPLFPFIERIFADAGYQGPRYARTVAAFIRLAMISHHAQTLDQTKPLRINLNFLDRLLEPVRDLAADAVDHDR
ncbi:MAG: hypothetical protein ABSD08_19655 [Xanthobacteraceae bacterium]|jgi:hypothetical protein